jgi:hypothetical protein
MNHSIKGKIGQFRRVPNKDIIILVEWTSNIMESLYFSSTPQIEPR